MFCLDLGLFVSCTLQSNFSIFSISFAHHILCIHHLFWFLRISLAISSITHRSAGFRGSTIHCICWVTSKAHAVFLSHTSQLALVSTFRQLYSTQLLIIGNRTAFGSQTLQHKSSEPLNNLLGLLLPLSLPCRS